MKNAIKNRIPIDVDIAPLRDEIYSGICLKANGKIMILVNFDYEQSEFTGITILLDNDVSQYRYWDDEELSEIKNNRVKHYEELLPIDNLDTLKDCFIYLKNKELVSFFTKDDANSYYVGQIISVNQKQIEVKLINQDSEWIGCEKFDIDEINYIGFDTKYEYDLAKQISV